MFDEPLNELYASVDVLRLEALEVQLPAGEVLYGGSPEKRILQEAVIEQGVVNGGRTCIAVRMAVLEYGWCECTVELCIELRVGSGRAGDGGISRW